jgi:hypothetical protein
MRARLLAALLAAGALGGCAGGADFGERAKPDPRPTAAKLRALRAVPYPAYWLGPRYRGMKLSAAARLRDRVIVRYGRPSCSEGCEYPLSVFSQVGHGDAWPGRAETRSTYGPACFRRVRRAVVWGCGGEYELFTGRSDIGFQTPIRGLGPAKLARGLLPMNAAARSRPRLAAPRPLPCRRFRRLPGWFAAKMPAAMIPPNCESARSR